jgi:DNA segregation ATPase FtsK/SpoIIIE, S-DNA-T family
MSTRRVRRRIRMTGPALPGGDLELQPPPELPRLLPRNVVSLVLPAVMVIASVGFVFLGGLSPTSLMMGAMMAVSTVGMAAGGGDRLVRRGQLDQDRRDYLRYLAGVRASVRTARADQRAALEWVHPHPRALLTLPRSHRAWERRRSHPDFLRVRIARGRQRLAVRLVAPPSGPVDELEPVCAVALRRFVRMHAVVADLPLALQLRGFAAVAVGGDVSQARGLVRAVLAELLVFHAPEDLSVAAVVGTVAAPDWEWLKWAPHAQDADARDGAGSRRLICPSLATLEEWLGAELADRPCFSRPAAPAEWRPVVVVVDGARPTGAERLVCEDGVAGVTVIGVGDVLDALPARARLQLEVADGRVGARSSGRETEWLGAVDVMSVAEAESVARQLAPLRLGAAPAGTDQLSTAIHPGALLGLPDLGRRRAAPPWSSRPLPDRLRVPIGSTDAGEAVHLDLKEAALGGMGPHGLVIGATGSGKSELLRTLVLGLAATHSPEEVNLVLVDFKGGAAFAGLARLPHAAAVITNLAADLTMVDRMWAALSGELNRRQELLRAAGNVGNVGEYAAVRARRALPALPALLVICDEFSELLSQKPELTDLFVTIGRLGRSLGVHLLLASQRLEEGRLRGLDSHLSYRIALRTFSAAESRAVLGSADAHELPSVPGSALLKYDTTSMVRFKTAYVSGPHRERLGAEADVDRVTRSIRPFSAGHVPEPLKPEPRMDRPEAGTATLLDAVVESLARHGPRAHEVWLPPLDESPALGQLLPGVAYTAERGLTASGMGRLRVPVAVVDRPYLQRRDVLSLDLAGAAGHVAVVGGPHSGKSTALRTLISALGLTHTPDEVQVYCVDVGGGSLAALAGLPHVGAVAGREDGELIRRTVAQLRGLLARREREFRRAGIDSIATFRARRANGSHSDEHGDVFLVVDGWLPFRQEFEELEPQVAALAGQGLSYGVHLVLSANRWADIRPALRDQLGSRIELKLGDSAESEVGRAAAAAVPAGRPGRGLSTDAEHLLMAVPTRDSAGAELNIAQADLVDQVSAAWHSDPSRRDAPPVRLLPAVLPSSTLPQAGDDARGVPIGVRETDLGPVFLDVELEPLLLVFGDAQSGKSAFLRLMAGGVVARYGAERARILAVDYRRGLLDAIPPECLAGYAVSAASAATLLGDLRAELERRLPGPTVTARQLRDRSWWTGRDVFVLVDDYDVVATATGNPIAVLVDLLAQARDVGLHLVLCRRTGGAARALFDPVISCLRELGSPGLMLSGDRDEGSLLGAVRPRPLPPGRAVLVPRREEPVVVQLAYLEA